MSDDQEIPSQEPPPRLEPLVPDPGGIIDPANLVDREATLALLLESIPSGGSYLVGDRRMGKTSLLRKAEAELRDAGHLVIRTSAELADLATFSAQLLQSIRNEARLRRPLENFEKELSGEASVMVFGNGLKLGGKLKRTGKHTEADLMSLCAQALRTAGPHRLVIIIDEIAVLANRLAIRDPQAGSDFLHSLRLARQTLDNVSTVLAGSVGLHHAVADLTSLNDLREIQVGALSHADATLLARRLLLWVYQYDDDASAALAGDIAGECGNIPYYIHRFVDDWRQGNGPMPTSKQVEFAVNEALLTNCWGTDHYFNRMASYYGPDRELAIEVLDLLVQRKSLPVDDLTLELGAAHLDAPPGRERVGELLRKLSKDHYTTVTGTHYTMASPWMARVWHAIRTMR
ncbi:MAG: AAA family ATPase [Beutenbergiaceae bacterium]